MTDKNTKSKSGNDANSKAHSQYLLNDQTERFELLNTKFQNNKIIGRKNEVLRFLLEAAGSGDDQKNKGQGTTFDQDNITRALMSSMINNNQFADY